MRVAIPIELNPEEQQTLSSWARGRRTPMRLVIRSRLILFAAEGRCNQEIARTLNVSRKMVGLWRERFSRQRLAGIEKDAPRGGRKPVKRQQVAERILDKTRNEKPKNASHWTVRTLATALGVSPSMVHRVWRSQQLKPHLVNTFKVSNDPQFVEKVIDVVGLYLNPPEHALVLSVDEKSSIQALDRTQPSLPMIPGRAGTLTHDYKRNGTTTLFAALEMAEGRIIATCQDRHRHQEWIKFLKLIDAETPVELDLHLILDHYATHKHPKVQNWLKRHPRFHLHFIPTSCSWLNMIERWFRELTEKRIRRSTFHNVKALVDSIMDYVNAHNDNPKSFVWTAKAQTIIEKVKRAKAVLDKIPTA